MKHHYTILSIILLCSILLAFYTVQGYDNYANPYNSILGCYNLNYTSTQTTQELTISITDDAIYKTAYYSIDGKNWTPINLSGTTSLTTQWYSNEASKTITLPQTIFNFTETTQTKENYLITYSCTAIDSNWDCHGNQWQIHTFNASYTPPVTSKTPIAWWKLDAHTQDSIGTNHGTNTGAITTTGVSSGAYTFDGTDYIQANPYNTISDFTLTAWIKMSQQSVANGIFINGYTNTNGFRVRVDTSNRLQLIVATTDGSSWNIYAGAVPLNNWAHIAVVGKNGVYIEGYINGQLAFRNTNGTGAARNKNFLMDGTSNKLYIGSALASTSERFIGDIDEVMLFNQALNATEIQNIYTTINNPNTCELHSECNDNDATTTDTCTAGNCVHTDMCVHNDNTCNTSICNYGNDNDCDECPVYSNCNDGIATNLDSCVNGNCQHINQCVNNDAQCPVVCSSANDNDCGECTSSADCTPGTCQKTPICSGTPLTCSFTAITTCSMTLDSCCPSGCTFTTDADCTAPNTGLIVVDHTSTNISKIPDSCIQKVKQELHIAYSHTSHGSQLVSGMQALQTYNTNKYSFSDGGGVNALDFDDLFGMGGCLDLSACDGDINSDGLGNMYDMSANYLSTHSDVNVILWSWCNIAGHNIPRYLTTMQALINNYPNVTFVFITGHANGGGVGDTSDSKNQLIRSFVYNASNANKGHYFFDFSDMENYDPDGNYYLPLRVEDGLQYSSTGTTTKDKHWGDEYVARHPTALSTTLINQVSSCAHSPESGESINSEINCALKGQAAWHLFARMVGWDGITGHECS